MIRMKCKGHYNYASAIVEYAIIIGVVSLALTAMTLYIRKGMQGKIRDLSDYFIIGPQKPLGAPGVPGAPTIRSVMAGNGEVTVNFTAPKDKGADKITRYIVTSYPEGITAEGETSPIKVFGLDGNKAYTFTVRAANAYGTSLPSESSDMITPSTISSAPEKASIRTEKEKAFSEHEKQRSAEGKARIREEVEKETIIDIY